MGLPWWMKLDWRQPKVLLILCAIEFPFTVAALTIFGIADPNTYRTDLWLEGAKHGWNSHPSAIMYSYANYRPAEIPIPWAQLYVCERDEERDGKRERKQMLTGFSTTHWNVVITVLSMFMLLAKTVMYITHVFPPFFSTILHALLISGYAVAISRQAGPDYLDPDHPAKVPWYLTRGCGDPVASELQGYCKQAKAGFAVAILMW